MRHIIWRNRASAILGILIVLMPFTGFPESLRTAFICLFGLLIAVFGFSRESTTGYSYSQDEVKASSEPIQKPEEGESIEEETITVARSISEESPEVVVVKKRRTRKKVEAAAEMSELMDKADHIFDEKAE